MTATVGLSVPKGTPGVDAHNDGLAVCFVNL